MPTRDKEKQEERSLIAIPDSFKKIIITGGLTYQHYNEEGILILNIFDFLLNPNSLNI